MPLIIGLTGGIGSGKTAVSDYFAAQGIPILDADVIAHTLTAKHSPLLMTLKATFGEWVIDDDGNYNRSAMRAYVFNHPAQLNKLNAIIHPAIYHTILNDHAKATSAYVILSVPLLFEGRHKIPNLLDLCQHILVVDVPIETQLLRASARDKTTSEQILNIINKQISRDERLELAYQLGADVIENTGSLKTLHAQLAKLHQKYLTMAENHSKTKN